MTETMEQPAAIARQEQTGADELMIAVDTAPLTNDAECASLTAMGAQISERLKQLETKRKGITDPLRASIDAIMALFNPAKAVLERAKDRVKVRVLAYQDEARKRARAEQERQQKIKDDELRAAADARKKAEQERDDAAAKALEAETPDEQRAAEAEFARAQDDVNRVGEMAVDVAMQPVARVEDKTISRVTGGYGKSNGRFVHTIVDANQIPRQFMIVDDRAIRAAIDQAKRNKMLKLDDNDEPVIAFEIPGVKIEYKRGMAI